MNKNMPEYENPKVVDIAEARKNLEAEAQLDEEIQGQIDAWQKSYRKRDVRSKWKRRAEFFYFYVVGLVTGFALGFLFTIWRPQ